MKAAVWYGKRDIRVEERELRELHSDEIKVKVVAAGICGSDLHGYLDGFAEVAADKPNVVFGHEFSGVVEEIGANVENVKVGDRVAVYPIIIKSLNRDPELAHYYELESLGAHLDGGFAEYVIMPQSNAIKIPDHLSLDDAALVEPASVALQAVKNSGIKIGDSVAVFGAGPIGLSTVMAAKAAGAVNIIAIDLFDERLVIALEVGATHIVNSKELNPLEVIKEICPEGVDISFEAAGVEVTFKQAIDSIKIGGAMVVVSAFAKEIQWNPMFLMLRGIRLIGSMGYTKQTFEQVANLIANGQLPAKSMVTSQIKLDDIVENGFEELLVNKSQAKILVKLSNEQ